MEDQKGLIICSGAAVSQCWDHFRVQAFEPLERGVRLVTRKESPEKTLSLAQGLANQNVLLVGSLLKYKFLGTTHRGSDS